MERSLRHIFRPKGAALLLSALLPLLLTGCGGDRPQMVDGLLLPETVDYNLHVRSILSENCFACHGPDAMAREADLRLDIEEGAVAPLGEQGDRFAIVPGSSRRSELYKRITSDDPDYLMPSPDSNLSLSGYEVAVLKRWIDQGAEYKPHWSFIPPEQPKIPQVGNREWPITPVDHFILSRLEQVHLMPAPDASRETWLRRVSFDLTGLPPTLEQLDEFLADNSPEAYERVVDRLFASPAYGERMAMEWLDVARYADTHGYQDDGANEMWPWREWVIDAFNRNMPFDQFAIWQLAGDLLPDATREQKLATGFGRVHQQSQEGGIIGEEYRVEYVADRVATTGLAFLGMTMQCARCHDHKYDPISEKEYYEFAAFFDNINDIGQIPNVGAAGPTILLPGEEAEKLIGYLQNEILAEESRLDGLSEARSEAFAEWRQRTETNRIRPDAAGQVLHVDLNLVDSDSIPFHTAEGEKWAQIVGSPHTVEGISGPTAEFSFGNYLNLRNVASFERHDPFSFSFWVNPSSPQPEVPVLVKKGLIYTGYTGYDVSLFENRVSLRLIHGWPYNAIQSVTQEPLPEDTWSHVAVTYDGSSRAEGISIHVNGKEEPVRIEQNKLFKRTTIEEDEWYTFRDFMIGHFNTFDPLRFDGLRLDEVKVYSGILSRAEILALAGRDDRLPVLADRAGLSAGQQEDLLLEHYLLRADPEFRAISRRLHELRGELGALKDTLPEVMVMEERLIPRQSHIRERGMYDQLGERVEPNVPSAIMTFPEEYPRNRLGLARWILHPDNPLTARVVANRYWQLFFGEGLVDTPDDFGNQGALPSHPELLDWLAVRFRENGWDLQDLIREIVLSRTYRQSSAVTPELREIDPRNRLLARGPRYRLPAEMIRDNALLASGLLVAHVGGPSVFPYQPGGIWEETTSGRHLTEYVQDEGENLYRRSLYTFWKRTAPPPGMTTFDAAMRSHPTAKREQTSTPLQALNTMNDPIFVEASRHLAEQMMRNGGTLEERITYAFRTATSRNPKTSELGILSSLFVEELEFYREEPELAEQLVSTGDSPPPEGVDPVEVAAGTIVVNTIFNLDETLTKE